jgi:hypothetical protein
MGLGDYGAFLNAVLGETGVESVNVILGNYIHEYS